MLIIAFRSVTESYNSSTDNRLSSQIIAFRSVTESYNEAVGLSNICYSEPKAEVMTSRGDFHPRGLIGKLLYLRLWSASCTAKSFNE